MGLDNQEDGFNGIKELYHRKKKKKGGHLPRRFEGW